MEMTPRPDSLQPFLLRIEDYELLDRAGVFEGRRVELIEGMIVAVNAEHKPHMLIKNELMFRLRLALRAMGLTYDAFVEPTLALPPHSLPEPDVLVANVTSSSDDEDYVRLHQVAVVIEVGASSLKGDLGVKWRMYAAQDVPEYWVIDVKRRRVNQFWSPRDGAYQEGRTVPLAGELRSLTMPDLAIDGAGIL